MKPLLLPALTGEFGHWRYYQVIMRVSDIVKDFGNFMQPNYRIKTVEEVEEIYSRKGVSYLLQREFDPKRLGPIKTYIVSQPDKYLNNLTVAIFGGNPDWQPIDVEPALAAMKTDEETAQAFQDSFGAIRLTGRETLFVLDGQHRLKGLREAILDKPEIGQEQISVTLIIHASTDEGRKRTRRLFSTINRHAKPVSKGENVLLDEDDLSAIITRQLIEEYPIFKGKNAIAQNKTANLYQNQYDVALTTVLAVYGINEVLIKAGDVYENPKVRIRPTDDVIEAETGKIFAFWDKFFELFPFVVKFLKGNKALGLARNEGGPFYMRPIGQKMVADLYQALDDVNQLPFMQFITQVPVDIKDAFWHFILWNPAKETVLQNESLAKAYLFYHFGLHQSNSALTAMNENYAKNTGNIRLRVGPSLDLISKNS